MTRHKNIRSAIRAASQQWGDDEMGVIITLEDDGTFEFYGHGETVWTDLSDKFLNEQKIVELINSKTRIRDITQKMGISFTTLQEIFFRLVGDGRLLNSSIYFCWSEPERHIMQLFLDGKNNKEELSAGKITAQEVSLFSFLRHPHVFLGDLYSIVSFLEMTIHALVKKKLKEEFNHEWWRRGVHGNLRSRLATLYEEDQHPPSLNTEEDNKFCYTTFLHLSEIISKNWKIFGKPNILPPIYTSDKRRLENDFLHLNVIRNQTMHPIKESKIKCDQIDFLLSLRKHFD